ncbi:tyrocidine synthetase 1 [Pyrenophora tritici-repentis Pt-1C-BFP]|uniref:Tyrocidine synthetase 1 n=1 Tax=Pyrenophora tritici-repentis (strain Pt-1C-BFP) TaxID=426418 RepID=B2WP49_PYRTR|nr:tyrocidine synthetase 1 [Pyrenophora tritici-repentis Pt-1C-BFP]EDU44809.1 tyrocidine synthetase 1 [Pyrenophora tritici-repentis Pt-1C-BFP]
MARHQAVSQLHFFVFILNTLFKDPNYGLSGFVSISQGELEELWGWNTPIHPDIRMCHHDIISEQAARLKDKIAIEAWDGKLSYRQIEDYSTDLAQTLRLLDDSWNQIIPVLFEKSRWTVVAVVAVMKAGACFALLDPAQPEGRLRSITQQINATSFICAKSQATLAARIAPSATILPISESRFDKIYSPFAKQQPKTALPNVSPSAQMYVQFTSGSTGLPKGCLITHSQYTSGAVPRAHRIGYQQHSRVLDFASYAFDVCIDSMLCTLAAGGTLCTPSEERRMNDLGGAMRDMKVTFAGMTPSVARTLDVDILEHLDALALGGEGVSSSDATSWGQRTRIVNAYGPSETTVGATINPDVRLKSYITMGRAAGCALWLVEPNNHNKLVPIGAVGELLIEGPIVGNGYLDNPEKTEEVFIEDPEFLQLGSKTMPGRHGRMYKTGDLVRYDPDGDGEIIFVGRQDQQVKLRGQRIELAEIEYNMQKNLPSDCQLAAEVIKPGGSGEPTLVAFLVEQRDNGMRHLDGNIFGSFTNKFQTALQVDTKDIQAFSLLGPEWDAEQARVECAQLCSVDTVVVEDVYPCTPLQEGLMALIAKFNDAYVAQRVATMSLEAALKLKRGLEIALEDLPILRTRIINVPGRGLFQVVLKDAQLVREHGSDVAKYLEIDRNEPMELGKALFRYGLVEEAGSDKCHFVVTVHHAVYDGWAMPLVVERITRASIGKKTIRPASFKHFIKHLNQLDPIVANDYWRERLHGVNPYQFPPLPYKGYITQANSSLEHYVKVPTSVHSKLTLATIIRGAWALVSSLYMGHADIVFGETLTGRSAPVHGIEQIEGPMITTIPVRVRLSLDRPISEFLQTVHAQTVQQIPHEHLGLQNIRRLSRDARNACELRTGLVLNRNESESWGSKSDGDSPADKFLPADDVEAAREALKFNTYALMLVCTLEENGFLIMASFDSKCISSAAMERVMVVLDRIVTTFLGNPESKLGDLAVLDTQEEQDALQMRPKGVMSDSGVGMSPVEGATVEDALAPKMILSANEEKLRSLLSCILGMPEVDINPNDSFFQLGGDSIDAMRLVSDARAQGFNVSVAQVFQSKSFSELAASFGNEKEDKVLELLSRILGMPKDDISAQDSFFDLGGDSIGAMRLVSDARAQGLEISVAQVFKSKSLSELAASVQSTKPSQPDVLVGAPFGAPGKEASLYSADRIFSYLENQE